ncbi:putative ribonuclease H-like domain-containing protein [Tanacetum coccineum]
MSIDDLYNNFKIVEQKVKKSVDTSSGVQNLAFITAPSSSSTNDANTASSQVSAASPSINTASPQVCTASVSDNTVYAFMVENTNGSNVLHQDLEQIHEDGLEVMDLKWQLSLQSMRAIKYYQRTDKKIFINVQSTRKQGNNEDTSKAMLAIDGVGFDWSDMAEEQVQTNMALMAFSDSEKQYDDLLAKQHQTEFKAITYKRGLNTVEAQFVIYRKNEVLFSEEVAVLKREVGVKQYEINVLKTEFEKVKQEKDAIDFKIEKFGKASKDLDQLLGSQITDKSKKGFGYSAVPPPHPLIYNRPNKLDLSYSGLDEFKEPEFKGYGPENNKKESNVVCDKESENSKDNSVKSLVEEQVSQVKSSFVKGCEYNTSKSVSEVEPKKVRKNNDALIIEDWVSDDEEQDESKTKPEKKIVIPTAAKIEKPVKKSVRYAEMYRSQSPKGNQRNWNGQKSNQLGSEFVICNKACFICGSFNHVQKNCTYHQKKKGVSGNNYNRVDNDYYAKTSHHRTYKNMTPRGVLLRTSLKPLSTAKHFNHKVNTVRPRIVNTARSYKTPINTVRPRIVNTARSYRTPVNTVRPRVVNTARPNRTSVNAARANGFNAGKPQHDDKGFVVSGCSRHITGGAYGGKIFGTSEESSQDCIVMPIWKDTSYFDSPTKNVDNGEPKIANDAQKQVEDGLNNENAEQESLKLNIVGSSVSTASPNEEDNATYGSIWSNFSTKDETSEILKNFIKEIENLVDKKVKIIRSDNGTEFKNKVMDDFCREKASPNVNTGSSKLKRVDTILICSSYDQDSPKDMFTIGASHTLEATHVEFFSDEDEP